MRNVNALPREEAVGRRVSVVKLQKDYERVKTQYQTILSNYSTLRVDRSAGAGGRDSDGPLSAAFDTDLSTTDSQRGGQRQQQAMLLHGQDVDDAIIEEREQDIRKINQDLVLVNEMFRWGWQWAGAGRGGKDAYRLLVCIMIRACMYAWMCVCRDMAQIVEGQGKTIEKIAEDTEASRERAEQGLAEVKQAAVYQPTCTIS